MCITDEASADMSDTLRAMRALESSGADPDLVAALLSAASDADAVVSFTLLRGTITDEQLLMLVNLREILSEIPEAPFRVGEDLELLVRANGYEDTGRSFRRAFESAHGVFGLEFVGAGRLCEGIFVHTPTKRVQLGPSGDYRLDSDVITLILNHRVLLDAILEALELLGLVLSPAIYVTVEDFVGEHGVAVATEAFGELF
jgi:hypothetical protein